MANVALLLLLAGCAAFAHINVDQGRRTDLNASIERQVQNGFSGQVLVAYRGSILLDRAYGYADAPHALPVNRSTGYDVASVTKNFTAAAILKLRDTGRLQVASKIGELLTATVPIDKRGITVEQLLAHRSGLASTYAADGETDRTIAEQKLLSQPLAFTPGTDFKYSDDGYVLLAAIVEEVSDLSYENFLLSELFQPAGMVGTFFWGSSRFNDRSRTATMSRALDARLTRPHWGQRGSGGVISTADDLYRWWQALKGGKVIRRSSVQELLAVHSVLKSGIGAGFGWFTSTTVRGAQVIWARGNEDFGYSAILAIYPRQAYVIVVTSNTFKGDEPWSRVVENDLERLLIDRLPSPD